MDKMDFSYLGWFKITIALSKNNHLEREFLGSLARESLCSIGPLHPANSFWSMHTIYMVLWLTCT